MADPVISDEEDGEEVFRVAVVGALSSVMGTAREVGADILELFAGPPPRGATAPYFKDLFVSDRTRRDSSGDADGGTVVVCAVESWWGVAGDMGEAYKRLECTPPDCCNLEYCARRGDDGW